MSDLVREPDDRFVPITAARRKQIHAKEQALKKKVMKGFKTKKSRNVEVSKKEKAHRNRIKKEAQTVSKKQKEPKKGKKQTGEKPPLSRYRLAWNNYLEAKWEEQRALAARTPAERKAAEEAERLEMIRKVERTEEREARRLARAERNEAQRLAKIAKFADAPRHTMTTRSQKLFGEWF